MNLFAVLFLYYRVKREKLDMLVPRDLSVERAVKAVQVWNRYECSKLWDIMLHDMVSEGRISVVHL